LQLLDDKTDAFNLHEKNGSLRKRSAGNPMKDLRIKILMGDKSDNIPPVMQRMGTKTAEKLSELPEDELRRQLDNKKNGDLTAWEQYEINRKLIDLYWMMRNHQQNFDERVKVNIV
jgi:5'-3' exonuclease